MKSKLFFVSGWLLTILFIQQSEAQLAQYYSLTPEKAYCATGHSITITMMYLNKDNTKVPATSLSGTWYANGQAIGKIDPANGELKATDLTLTKVTYTAPQQVPSSNPVAISVSFQPDPRFTTQVTLICNITVIDMKNYFSLDGDQIPNHLFEFDPRASYPGSDKALMIAGGLKMSLNGFLKHDEQTPATISMTMLIHGSGVGTYPWQIDNSDQQNSTMVTVACSIYNGRNFTYASAECDPAGQSDCKVVSEGGTTSITKFNSVTKEVEGYFSGTVTTIGEDKQYHYENIEGGFTATLFDVSSMQNVPNMQPMSPPHQ